MIDWITGAVAIMVLATASCGSFISMKVFMGLPKSIVVSAILLFALIFFNTVNFQLCREDFRLGNLWVGQNSLTRFGLRRLDFEKDLGSRSIVFPSGSIISRRMNEITEYYVNEFFTCVAPGGDRVVIWRIEFKSKSGMRIDQIALLFSVSKDGYWKAVDRFSPIQTIQIAFPLLLFSSTASVLFVFYVLYFFLRSYKKVKLKLLDGLFGFSIVLFLCLVLFL